MGLLNAQSLHNLIPMLTEQWETEHFVLHYVLRNPLVGKGHGSQGIGHLDLVQTYGEALEAAYRVLRTAKWQRELPLTNPAGRTDVYLCDVAEPFMTVWRGQYPVIVLPSCRTLAFEQERVLAETVHEVMHLFNFRQRPIMAINGNWGAVRASARWKWLDEGMALYLEGIVFEQNRDRYRFVRAWVNQPDMPLDDKRAIYQTGMFVHYLYKRFGYGLVNEVWTKAAQDETPWAAFDRVLQPHGLRFVTPDADVPDVFSAYCSDAFFLRDPASHCYEPEIEELYGERTLTESFVLKAGQRVTTTSQLDHLACRYFRFTLVEDAHSLRVQLQTPTGSAALCLKAELAVLTPTGERGTRQMLRLPEGAVSSEPACLCATWPTAATEQATQFVLIVSNCGTRPQQANLHIPHDDGQAFALEVTAA